MGNQLDTFETQLLADLRDHVTARAAAAQPATTVQRSPWKGRLVVLGAGLAAATLGFTVLPGVMAGPAYAVQTGANGTVHVEVNRLEDAAGLKRALERHGVTADVRYLGDNTRCAADRYLPAPSAPDSATSFTVGPNGISIDIDRRDLPPGGTVVIAASRIPDGVYAEVGIADGQVRACVPMPL